MGQLEKPVFPLMPVSVVLVPAGCVDPGSTSIGGVPHVALVGITSFTIAASTVGVPIFLQVLPF